MVPEDPLVVSISSNSLLHPDEIARKTFPTARKGLEAEAVRRYLDSLSAEVRELLEHQAEVRRRLADAERRAAEPEIDEATLTRAVGSETARILQTAHQAARDVIATAEVRAAQMMEEAEGLVAERSAAADEEAAGILAGAEQEAARLGAATMEEVTALRSSAQLEADELIVAAGNEAAAILAATKQECRQMVREARELRHRVLNDLADRRRALRVQLAQLRTGRDSLIEVVDAVGDVVDKVRDRLATAEHEARLAAAQAGERAERFDQDEELLEERQLHVHLSGDEAPRPEIRAGAEPAGTGVVAPQPGEEAVVAPQPGEDAPPAPRPGEEAVVAPEPGEDAPPAPQPGESVVDAQRDGRDLVMALAVDEALAVEGGDEQTLVAPAGEASTRMAPPGSGLDPAAPSGTGLDQAAPSGAESEPSEPARADAANETAPGPHRSVGELFARLRGSRGSTAREAGSEVLPVEPASGEPEIELPGSAADAASGFDPTTATATDETELVQAIDTAGYAGDAASELGLDGDGPAADVEETGVLGDSSAHEAAVEELDEDLAETDEPRAPGADVTQAPSHVELAAVALSRRSELLAPVMTRLSRALKRALQDDQNELLDSIRHAAAPADLDSLLPAEAHRFRYEQAASLALSDAWTVGRLFVRSGDEGEPSSASAEKLALTAEEAGRELGAQLAAELTGLLRHRLSESLATAGGIGGAAHDITGAAYREWKGSRIEAVAGDFAIAAFSRGEVTAGEGTLVRWVVDDDGQPCPDCDDNSLAGPQAAGDPFPTGQPHPPVHSGCRCLLVSAVGS
jgi:cell division septum initiation protein DivIVA